MKTLYILQNMPWNNELLESYINIADDITHTKIDDIIVWYTYNEHTDFKWFDYLKHKYPIVKDIIKKEIKECFYDNPKKNEYVFYAIIELSLYLDPYRNGNLRFDRIKKDHPQIFYMSFDANMTYDRLIDYTNVYHLGNPAKKPHCLPYLTYFPFLDIPKSKLSKPTFLIYGDIARKDPGLFSKFIEFTNKNSTNPKKPFDVIYLNVVKQFNNPFIQFKIGLDNIRYCKEFTNDICYVPMISKRSFPTFYIGMSSCINFIRGFKNDCIMDSDSIEMHDLNTLKIKNLLSFNSLNVDEFEKCLRNYVDNWYLNI